MPISFRPTRPCGRWWAMFDEVRDRLEEAVLRRQEGKKWAGRRVERLGIQYRILVDDPRTDRMVVRELGDRPASWRRSRFLRRALLPL